TASLARIRTPSHDGECHHLPIFFRNPRRGFFASDQVLHISLSEAETRLEAALFNRIECRKVICHIPAVNHSLALFGGRLLQHIGALKSSVSAQNKGLGFPQRQGEENLALCSIRLYSTFTCSGRYFYSHEAKGRSK